MSGAERRTAVSVPVIPDTIAWAEVDGETVAYDEIHKKVHLLSPTATLIWSGIDGRTSFEQIARDLSRSFGMDLSLIRSDVEDLARDLQERGLINEAGSGGPATSAPAVPTAARGLEDDSLAKVRFLEDPPSG
jgi:coenzyme PQQ synthesis protein D (PqqD)